MRDPARSVITASQILLGAVWIAAFASIPSATDYQSQLDGGAKPAEITTMYDSVSFFVSIALIVSWSVTSGWLRAKVDATPVRLEIGRAHV